MKEPSWSFDHVVQECCFELLLRDAALLRSQVGEEFSTSVWDRCQSKIVIYAGVES